MTAPGVMRAGRDERAGVGFRRSSVPFLTVADRWLGGAA